MRDLFFYLLGLFTIPGLLALWALVLVAKLIMRGARARRQAAAQSAAKADENKIYHGGHLGDGSKIARWGDN